MPADTTARVALIAGASGVVGSALVTHLSAQGWDVIALARRAKPLAGGVSQAVDLGDRAACRQASATWHGVTHLFYTAYLPDTDLVAETRTNAALLVNLLDALEPAAPHLAHVQLMQGSKWYGNHLGPYRTPAREDDPRHGAPCFYYAQQDWLAARQTGKPWTWSAVRPHGVLGLAIGSSMNQLTAMALYASVMKALGRKQLCWPGSIAAFDCIYQFTEAAYLATGAEWIATTAPTTNAAYNFTNGDLVRWRHLWPSIAAAFDMEPGEPEPQALAETMPAHEPLWAQLCAAQGLDRHAMSDLTNWRFADFVFHCGYDQISDLTRIRTLGWQGANASEPIYTRLLGDLRRRRIIP
jgi:nucleoside-diphosphate-sugar epimerase